MGNSKLQNPKIQANEDLSIFQNIYSRYQNHQARISVVSKVLNVIQSIDYDVLIKNEIFAEVLYTHTFKNTSLGKCLTSLPLYFITQQKLLLLEIRVVKGGKILEQGQYQRITNFLMEETDNNKFQDISSPHCQLNFTLEYQEVLQVQLKYLQTFIVHQNEFLILKISLPQQYSIKISMDIETLSVQSLTHKMINNTPNIYKVLDFQSPSFILMIQVSHNPKVYLAKMPFGHAQYQESQKYCALVTMLPNLITNNSLEDFMYFNNVPQQANDSQKKVPPSINSTLNATVITDGDGSVQNFFDDQNKLYSTHNFSGKQRRVSFFMDQSNSMNDERMNIARKALIIFMKSLPQEAAYNLYSFGSGFNKFYNEHMKVSEDNIKLSIERIQQLQGDMGSTFLLPALEDYLDQAPSQDYENIWFILTDGYLAEQEKILSLIKKNQNVRVFSLGIGQEFDKQMVESMAYFGNGSFQFCENLRDLPSSVIKLQQIALASRLTNFHLNELPIQSVSQIYPDPKNVSLCIDQRLLFTSFFYPAALENKFKIAMKYQQDNLQNPYPINIDINFEEAVAGGYVHLYSWSLILNEILFNIEVENYNFSFLQMSENQIQFYDLQKNCDRYHFLNPLTTICIRDQYLCMNISMEKLAKFQKQYKNRKTLTQIIFAPLFKQPTFKDQFIQGGSSLTLQQEQRDFPCSGLSSQIQTIREERKDFFMIDKHQYDSRMLELILIQDIDGSFPYQQTLILINSIASPLYNLPVTFDTQSLQSEEQQNIKLPQFLVEKIWSTSLAIAFLKNNYPLQRGEWLLVYVKARQFINQYLNNMIALLNQASRTLTEQQSFGSQIKLFIQ